jgi:ABC-2 type transport system ATP-binding protein
MSEHPHILSIEGVSKRFGTFEALKNVSFSIPKGQIFGLLGPNGAGKTTLIRTITQITAPDDGSIRFQGESLRNDHIQHFGYLPEERGLYRKMKVWDQAMYLVRLKGLDKHEAQPRLKQWFERLEMTDWAPKSVEDLSKGMQQKLQFVIAVANNPAVLILDEPFSGFDPVNTEVIKQEILRIKEEGTTIIFSTHNMASVEELCDSIALLNRGEKVINGAVSEVRSSFRKSLYEVHFVGSKMAFANLLGYRFEIVDFKEGGTASSAVVKAHDSATGNELVQLITPHLELLKFQEMIPSMHDIFIDLVQPSNEASAKA